MKRLAVLILLVSIIFSGCGSKTYAPDAEQQQQAATKQTLNEMNNQIGMPNIKEFYEKKLAKEIYELRDNSKLICYAYTQGMNGKMIYLGRCMGYGLPYSTQYTNPEKMGTVHAGQYNAENPYTLPQADPNGLYMPQSASATWIMLINEQTGKREIMYCEPNLVVNQSKLPKRLCEDWSLPDNY